MRTLLFLVAGLLLLGACLLLGRRLSAHFAGAACTATLGFVLLWLAIPAGKLGVRIARAGYTLLPIC